MRIVHVTQFFMPWLGYLPYYLPREMVRAGHEVCVLSSNLRWPGGSYSVLAEEGVARELPVGRGVEREVPCVRLAASRFQPKGTVFLKGLRAWLQALRPEVVVSYLYGSPVTMQVARLQKELGFRLWVVETQLPHQAQQGWKHRLLRRSVRAMGARVIQPRAEGFVSVAHGATDWLEQGFGVPRERVTYIPLGVDPEVFRARPEDAAAWRAEQGFAPEDYLLAYTGKLMGVKQVEALIDAVALYRARAPEGAAAKLLLVGKGEGDFVASLVARAEAAGVPVLLEGSQPAEGLALRFNAADVCVWPADCSISHLEAAACGTPIVIPAGTGVDDRVGGGNGLMVSEGDPEAIYEALVRLADPELRRVMGEAALEWTRAHYLWPAVGRRWLEAFGEATGAG